MKEFFEILGVIVLFTLGTMLFFAFLGVILKIVIFLWSMLVGIVIAGLVLMILASPLLLLGWGLHSLFKYLYPPVAE